jgi:hypothetical protein
MRAESADALQKSSCIYIVTIRVRLFTFTTQLVSTKSVFISLFFMTDLLVANAMIFNGLNTKIVTPIL